MQPSQAQVQMSVSMSRSNSVAHARHTFTLAQHGSRRIQPDGPAETSGRAWIWRVSCGWLHDEYTDTRAMSKHASLFPIQGEFGHRHQTTTEMSRQKGDASFSHGLGASHQFTIPVRNGPARIVPCRRPRDTRLQSCLKLGATRPLTPAICPPANISWV